MYNRVMTSRSGWTLLTNHAVVLLCVSEAPDMTLRDIADRVGITERAVHRIVTDLVTDGFVVVRKRGRRNHYEIQGRQHLRHDAANHVQVSQLLRVLNQPA